MDRVLQIREAAIAAMAGETRECPEPYEPTRIETQYLEARDLLRRGRFCAGSDLIEATDLELGHDTIRRGGGSCTF